VDEQMDKRVHIEEMDKKMQEQGWKFIGAILHYKKAWKNQAAVYEWNEKYVVSGLDASGKNELHEPIEKKEALKRMNESLEEIRKRIFEI